MWRQLRIQKTLAAGHAPGDVQRPHPPGQAREREDATRHQGPAVRSAVTRFGGTSSTDSRTLTPLRYRPLHHQKRKRSKQQPMCSAALPISRCSQAGGGQPVAIPAPVRTRKDSSLCQAITPRPSAATGTRLRRASTGRTAARMAVHRVARPPADRAPQRRESIRPIRSTACPPKP